MYYYKKLIRNALFALLIAAGFLSQAIHAHADVYKYTDRNDTLVYTDDLSAVPKGQREGALLMVDENINDSNEEGNIQKSRVEEPSAGENILDIEKKRKQLKKEKAELDKELDMLNNQKQKLEPEEKNLKSTKEKKAFYQKVQNYNQKIKAYNQKQKRLEERIEAFNQSLVD